MDKTSHIRFNRAIPDISILTKYRPDTQRREHTRDLQSSFLISWNLGYVVPYKSC